MMLSALQPAYSTHWGKAYLADARDFLRKAPDNSVQLVITSPPFPLRRRKAYGNVPASEYVEWFYPFAEEIYRILKPQGSLVLDLGGTWNPSSGTRSLYQYELILKLCRIFHLAQEFYWHNPAKLPTPAEWVTIKRTRVKDSVNTIWWLSKTPTPQADNRRVLQPYSKSMLRLLKEGYDTAVRPSQHKIGPHFRRDNGGAIPSNLLSVSNTRSRDPYIRLCRAASLPVHPARFAHPVPEFFIKFLTEPTELVVDPFAGSNVTGEVAERLERSWVSVEVDPNYVAGSRLRFSEAALSSGCRSAG